MKILELFSGYGTASFALKRLGIDYELVGYSDIDKYANQCFRQNHYKEQDKCETCAEFKDDVVYDEDYKENICGKCFNGEEKPVELGNIKNIDPFMFEEVDLITGGFPCQAFSNAGKMKGELDPRGTLFYEIIRIAEIVKPKYMLLENVKGLTSKKFKDTFSKILSELDRIGYNVYWKILNSKDYGIPQSRARVWFVCFRKDIDNGKFQFPNPKELKIFIKDILEEQVDSKYYLSPLLQERFKDYMDKKVHSLYPRTDTSGNGGHGHLCKDDGPSYTVDTGNCQAVVANRYRNLANKGECYEERIDGCSNNLTNVQKDNLVYDRKGFDSRTKGFRESELSPTLSTKMGTGGNNVPMIVNTLKSRDYKGVQSIEYVEKQDFNVIGKLGQLRRLTPKECFRLMGFLNDEIKLDGLSDTQRYKLAGNGQDVNMVSLIFKEMFK